MSRFSGPSGRVLFASSTVYDALEVDSGEETEEEIVQEIIPKSLNSLPEEPPKPTKSAIKKANRLARIERKRQAKVKKDSPQQTTENTQTSPTNSEHSTPAQTPEQPRHETIVEPLSLEPTVVLAPTEMGTLDINGDVHKVENPEPSTDLPMEPIKHRDSAPVAVVAPAELLVPNIKPPPPLTTPPNQGDSKKVEARQNAVTRTLWTFIMIGGFIMLLSLGHAYMILLVMLCQTLVYREVTALFSLKATTRDSRDIQPIQGKDPWSKTLNWYFFAVTNYFLYGESIIYYFKHVVFADAQLLPFATNHRMISFTLYTIGFMGFVMSLKKGYLKQQFGLFCWVHMSLLLIVISSHFIMNSILEGLIWFFVPASLVICNDIFAYICGKTFGRTPLIELSPKKTVEGFTGAFITTLLFAVWLGTYTMRFNYMICPVHDLGVHAWSSMQCTPNPVFVWKNLELWPPIAMILSTLSGHAVTSIPYAPYQLHLLVLACFASLVAPFGGFFASGFKRAFGVKDFGHSIPGHGGMTDRMDCQFLMGVFVYVYYSSLIREHHVTVGGILQTIVSGLSVDDQLELLADLRRYLETQGVDVP